MRLRRLDLIRYGKFTDRTIEFGPKPNSGPDLHIVFGLNEAGKSTALSGCLDLLFGIEERSRYNFLHEYSAMRIGGVLEFGGEEHAFSRTKQRNNSLLNATGQPVSELAITAHLAGLSRDAYQTMFSLDDETLEVGGKSILESRGDLGKLLFTASAGLGHASDTLSALEAEADGLYRKQAHGTELALLKKRLAELKSGREAIDTLASTFETLESERLDATENYDRSIAERSVLSARLDTIAKYLHAVPILADIRRKTARLAELPDIASPPRTWTGSVAEMIDDDASLRTRLSGNTDEVERVTMKIASVDVDEVILAISERVRSLVDRKVRYVSAGLDLPSRRTELQILDNAVAICLAALGRSSEPDPAALLLPAATVGAVRNMVEQRSGIATRAGVARDEAAAALDALQTARERVGEERAVPEPARARLASALSKARGGGHLKDIKAAREAEDASTIRWEAAISRLHPWFGDARALARVPVPSAGQVGAWKTLAAELGKSRAVLSERLAEHRGNHELLSARLDALRASADVADDEAAAAIRRARNEAWAKHRGELTGETADDFAVVLSRDDSIGAVRLVNARELAEIRTTIRSLAETTVAIARTRDHLAQIDLKEEAALSELRAAASELLASLEFSPERLIELIENCASARTDALAAWEVIELARKKAGRAVDEGDQIRLELIRALESVGIGSDPCEDLETLMAVAELFLDRQLKVDAERAEAIRTVSAKEEDLAARRRALDVAERREEEWLAGITEALEGTWLESGISAPGVGNVLDQLAELSKSIQERDAMRLRIEKMEADRDNFIVEVTAAAAEAGESANSDEPEQLAIRLAERLERADRARETKAALVNDLQRLQDTRDILNVEAAAHERRKTEVLGVFGVATLSEVVERDELLRDRDRLRAAAADLEEQLSAELGVEGFAQARSILDALDFDSLAIEKAEGEQRFRDLDEAIQNQLIRQTRAADKLDAIGGDSAVARIDAERRTVLLEIEEKAVRYIELKLGVMSAGNALRVYRERHRSGMMKRASDAFALITRGQYSGLATQPVKGGEVLIALQRDGQSKVADALSKGARFQLYLALRLAGYYEFAQFRPSVPFIADDIMETFDHFRSEEVFRLFGEMASAGQVIYLTHHQHLCEIAKAVVPGVTIHDLG
ncbi:sugar translocase [Mesorhizobium tianshanense]|uniref:AAA domain-containing protein n=1 Tax=Mesorhizobium tianshanense TaxID=39844 RepID=A0A562N3Q8_9HYPH|nr:AAA family ATPase [Mesorhizobium tianshanense]TWI26784.1 AAA domain-containing protein [Mesorhizobium tianshanense]GLS36329.1 sugar translocase [Mesorhizobium tianshanense]